MARAPHKKALPKLRLMISGVDTMLQDKNGVRDGSAGEIGPGIATAVGFGDPEPGPGNGRAGREIHEAKAA